MSSCPKCGKQAPEGALVCEHDGTPLVTLDGEAASTKGSSNEILEAGSTVGEYRILELLGEGGFGAVYRAEHPVIGKSAAIKVVKREYGANTEMTSRFVSEARAVNQIRHRNIIDIFNFGNLPDGRPYYVMELLDGCTLDALLKERGRLPFAEAQPIFRQLARALAAAHGAGIAHRDLKPENVFVAFDEDGQPTPKLLDFGLAKLLGEGMSLHRTRSGVPMGTPLYMSPEQVYGKDVDHRTDIYAFGIMVFQTLTGDLPFYGDSVMEVMVKQTAAERPDASSVCPDLPKELDEPIRRMMAKDPAERPESIVEAIDALFLAAQEAGISTSGAGMVRPAEPHRRSDAGVIGDRASRSGAGSSSGKGGTRSGAGASSGAARAASTSSKRAAQASSTSGLATEDTIADPRLRLAEPPPRSSARTIGLIALTAVLLGGAFFAQQRLSGAPRAEPSVDAEVKAAAPESPATEEAIVTPTAEAAPPVVSAAASASASAASSSSAAPAASAALAPIVSSAPRTPAVPPRPPPAPRNPPPAPPPRPPSGEVVF